MTQDFNRLEAALGLALLSLKSFALNGGFSIEALSPAFGAETDDDTVKTLATAFAAGDFSLLPPVVLSDSLEEAGAHAAYVAPQDTDAGDRDAIAFDGVHAAPDAAADDDPNDMTGDFGAVHAAPGDTDVGDRVDAAFDRGAIYVSRSYAETASTEALAKVLLEEIGHAIDVMINATDAAGDEGAIFANLVLGRTMSEDQLAALQAEDDHVTLEIDGVTVAAEAAQTFVVTTLDDQFDDLDGAGTISLANFGGAGDLSLREAVALANADETTADRIEFDAALAGGTIELFAQFGGGIDLTSDMTIDGDIDGDGAYDITVMGAAPDSPRFLVYNSYGTFIAPEAEDTIALNGLYFFNGMHDKGGAIQSSATMTVSNSLFTNNFTLLNTDPGGGAIWSDGDLTVVGSEFLLNTTGVVNQMLGNYFVGGGGAIRTAYGGSLTVRESHFEDNGSWYGGAIWSDVETSVFDSTFTSNAAVLGGAMYVRGGNTPVLLDGVTMTQNVGYGDGAAYSGERAPFSAAGTILTIRDSTITENTFADMRTHEASVGWRFESRVFRDMELAIDAGEIEVSNSIILGNDVSQVMRTLEPDGVTLTGGNIIQSRANPFFGDLTVDGELAYGNIRIDEIFIDGELRDNGGPVRTIALLESPFNPALDAADDSLAGTTDSRGAARVDQEGIGLNGDNIADLGAYEVQNAVDASGIETPSLVVNTAEDVDDAYDGLTSLREAIDYANTGLAGNAPVISFDADVFDGEAQDIIVLTGDDLYITQPVTIDAFADAANGSRIQITRDSEGDDLDADGLTLAQGGTGITDLALSAAAGTLDDNLGRIFNISVAGGNTVTLNGLILTGGNVGANSGDGGAVTASGDVAETGLTVSNSLIAGNQVQNGYGGGIRSGDDVTLINTIVSGNGISGNNFGLAGGGIYAGGDATLVNSTVTNNFNNSMYSGGIDASRISLTNSIVTGNKHGPDSNTSVDASWGLTLSGGNIVDDTFSIDGVAQQTGLTSGDIFAATDANSAAGGGQLVLRGGNAVMALKDDTANPAIDGGDDALAPALDGLGAPRVDWADTAHNGTNISDLGASELRVAELPVAGDDTISGDEDTVISGDVSLNDSDPAGDALWYELATAPTLGTIVFNLDGTFDYTPNPNVNGADGFTYTVSDRLDGTATGTVTITIDPVNDAPTVRNVSFEASEDASSVNDLTALAQDIDRDTITLASVGTPSFGAAFINEDGLAVYTPDPDFAGEDSFTFTVSDGNGGTATATAYVYLNGVNDPPSATDDAAAGDEDTVISGDVSLNDEDVDGDTLSFGLYLPASHGEVVMNADGTFDYTPDANFFGTDSFGYAASDGKGGSAVATVRLTVASVNDLPVAPDISDWVVEDRDRLGFLSDYVSDVESDINGLSFELGTAAANGAAVVNPGGSYYYTPDPDFFGADSFTYIVRDADGGSAIGTVTFEVRPMPDAPEASYTPGGAIVENTAGVALGTLAVSDADGDTDLTIFFGDSRLELADDGITVKLKDGASFDRETDGDILSTFVEVVDPGFLLAYAQIDIPVIDVNDVAPHDIALSGRSVLENAAGAVIGTLSAVDEDGPSLTLTVSDDRFEVAGSTLKLKDDVSLDREAEPTVTVSVTASDGAFDASQDFTITVENVDEGAPEDIALSNTTVEENATGVVGALSAFDVDGDAIAYSVADSRFAVSGETLSLVDPLDFESLPGGVLDLEVTATGGGRSTTETIALTVTDVNEAPEITLKLGEIPVSGKSFPLGVLENLQHATAAASSAPGQTLYPISFDATDPDADALTFDLTGADAAAFTVDAATGALVFNQAPDFEAPGDANADGLYEVTVSAGDGALSSNAVTLRLTLLDVAEAPVAADDAASGDEDTVISGDVSLNDSDPDGGTLSYALESGPAHGTLVLNADGSFAYTPESDFNGADSFGYVVTDEDGNGDTATVTLTVAPVNDAPVAADDEAATDEDTALEVAVADLLANDSDVDEGAVLSFLGVDTGETLGSVSSDGVAISYDPGSAFAGLAAGETGIDTILYTIADEAGAIATAKLTVSIAGLNDGPEITAAETSGAVAEDADDPTLTASGRILFDDPDLSDSHVAGAAFLSTTHADGRLGALAAGVTMDTTGTGTGGKVQWNFEVANAAAQFLGAGETVTETYRVTLEDASGATEVRDVAVTIAGANDAPTISGVASGGVNEDGALFASGTLVVTDADAGQSTTQPDAGTASYGSFAVDAAGGWTYTLDNQHPDVQALAEGAILSDSFTVSSQDGTATRAVAITITGANDIAVLGGDVFGSVVEDMTAPDAPEAVGLLTIEDADTGQSLFQSQTESTDYGTFVLGETGAWTFDLDNDSEAVQALDTGQSIDLGFTAVSADGSASSLVTVRVNGVDEVKGKSDGPNGDGDGTGGTQTGGAGDDVVEGGLGKDILFGGLGDDFLFGFEGSDELFGQEGADAMIGGGGNDVHTGGAGADTFFFEVDGGKDKVLDFEIGIDAIGFKASDGIGEADLRVKLQKSGAIQIAFDGDAMLLEGSFSASDLNEIRFYNDDML